MDAKLLINGEREIMIGEGVSSIGRTSENFISIEDPNISRFHAEIENRNGEFWLIELGSSNGTSVNGEPLKSERPLKNGDVILLGGSGEIIFNPGEKKEIEARADQPSLDKETEAESPQPEIKAEEDEGPEAKSKMPLMMGLAAGAAGIAIVSVVTVGLIFYTETKCEASARIISPASGETISEATEVEVEISKGECVGRARLALNGKEIALNSGNPYTASIDPAQFPELADGGTYDLQVAIEDKAGKLIQTNSIGVALETIEEEPPKTPTPEMEIETKPGKAPPAPPQGRQVSLAETQEMARRLLNQFSGKNSYKFEPQFLQQVLAKTNEYKAEGYSANAQKYRDAINIAFIKEGNLDPPLGYILAMSRSKFNPAKDKNNEEGLWKMSESFASANAFNGLCGGETLSDAGQNCAARAMAAYMKQLFLNIFERDIIYAISCIGMQPNEASAWKISLPADRANFWQVIKNPKQKEEIVKFFAAGIVAENPQKFGLKRDRPISEIYKNLME